MNVCPECFTQPGLKARIIKLRPTESEGPCDAHPHLKGVPIKTVADVVDPVFRELYVGAPDDGNSWATGRGDILVDVLYDLTGAADDDILHAMIEQLMEDDDYWPPDGEEAFYDPEYRYISMPQDFGHHAVFWSNFCKSLMYGQRFFNGDAERYLTGIFKGVQQQRNAEGQGPIYLIQPDDPQATFFRARFADTLKDAREIKAKLSERLGPPPERARRAGRLNPSGIAAFYGAFDLETCIAELRPNVGRGVIGAQFRITEPICVLDTTRFDAAPKSPNLFAAGALPRARQWRFMRVFMDEIAKPVSEDDAHLDYLPTQAVAEFLNGRFKVKLAGEHRAVDAIIFRSAQRPAGKNIVLLGDAAVVGAPGGQVEAAPLATADEELGWDWAEDRPSRPVRITPLVDTVVTRRINGAEFQSVEIPDDDALLDAEDYEVLAVEPELDDF
ncbi:MAG: RES family NAD+ phosphorylase [Pseudomonadota bacterium]